MTQGYITDRMRDLYESQGSLMPACGAPDKKKKVVFATPTITRPFPEYLEALEASLPAIEAAGWEHQATFEIGNPYISAARAIMTRKALDVEADCICYLDHDLSWGPEDIKVLLETEGEVVAGTYRYKNDEGAYMGTICTHDDERPITREDGCIKADRVPAGFLKVTRAAIHRLMKGYPDLLYGYPDRYSVDLFHHGAINGVWWGEDYAFCKRWCDIGGEIWIVPTLRINHHLPDKVFRGCFHDYLLAQPGGSEYKGV